MAMKFFVYYLCLVGMISYMFAHGQASGSRSMRNLDFFKREQSGGKRAAMLELDPGKRAALEQFFLLHPVQEHVEEKAEGCDVPE